MGDDTIFSRSTAPGRSGVMVFRVSGPKAHGVAQHLTGPLPQYRVAALRRVLDPLSGELIDEGLVVLFPEGHSFTGEDVVEFQLHGSVAVENALTRTLSGIEGLRLAEPGEFTRRALLNGKLDLTQVEGLSDLLSAETEAQRQQAISLQSGVLRERVEEWKRALTRAAALIASTIDFSDEDIPQSIQNELEGVLQKVARELEVELQGVAAAERIREGFEVAIIGRPNVGKSTFLNGLVRRDVAIVSDIPGTTRDSIEVNMELGGLPVTFVDTAGIRDTDETVEKLGIERTLNRAQNADLRIVLFDDQIPKGLQLAEGDLLVRTKDDDAQWRDGLAISAKTGCGLDTVLEAIESELSKRASLASSANRLRHRVGLDVALRSVRNSLDLLKQGEGHEDLVAEEIRSALVALAGLIGEVDVEDVLGTIFSTFCIGK